MTATMCGTAVLLFVGFVVGLAQRLDDGGAAGPGHAARVAGAITATLLLMGGALVAATTAGRKALGWRRWTAFVGWLSVVALLAPLAFAVLLILLLWTAVVSVWMLIFPRTAAQVTRA